jgi:hypothetical protein
MCTAGQAERSNMKMIDVIKQDWGWIGTTPMEIVTTNAFGNVIFIDTSQNFWRICPEELSCEVISESTDEYNTLIRDPEFKTDWFMENLVEIATQEFGEQPDDRCFCLKVPGVLGGEYELENMGTIPREELVSFAGDIARQIKDIPDGQEIQIDWKN